MMISDLSSTAKYQPDIQQAIDSATQPANHKSIRRGSEQKTLKLLTAEQLKSASNETDQSAKGKSDSTEIPTRETAQQATEKLKKALEEIQHNRLEFSIHEETGRTVIKVIDQQTGKVIKQLPPEELLDLAAKLEEMSGVLFDKKI